MKFKIDHPTKMTWPFPPPSTSPPTKGLPTSPLVFALSHSPSHTHPSLSPPIPAAHPVPTCMQSPQTLPYSHPRPSHTVTPDPPIQSLQTLPYSHPRPFHAYSHPRPSHTVTPDPLIHSPQTLPCIQSPQTIPYNHPRPFHTFILDPPIQSPQTLPYSHSRIHDPRASHTVAQTIPYVYTVTPNPLIGVHSA